MAVTTLRQSLNTFPTSVSGGATPDANKIVDVSDWAEALEPRKTPFLTWAGMGNPVDQRPFPWGQSQRVAIETTIGESPNNSQTTLILASGAGKLMQKWTVLEIMDYVVGSTTVLDQSTREIVIVTADPAADTVTILRGQSGTSAVSHTSGAKAFIIGTAEPENADHSISPISRGFQYFNYCQRFQGGVKADKAAQNMPTWETKGNPMVTDFEEEQKRLKVLLEMACLRGGRQQGTADGLTPATMGGIDTFITTNVLNMAGAKLTPRILEAQLASLMKTTDGGPEGITLLMSYDTARIFDLLLDPIRYATTSDTQITLMVERIKFRWGTYEIMTSHNLRNGVIYGVRKENFSVRPFKGLNWHVSKKDGSVHAFDRDEMYLSGDFTLQVLREASMFKFYAFNEDLSQYDQAGFGQA